MRTALVLSADNVSLPRQAGEINAALKDAGQGFAPVELWLFYKDRLPEQFPVFDWPLACIRLVALNQTHRPEYYLRLLEDLFRRHPMDLIVFPSNGWGIELATRLAYRVNGCACTQVERCDTASGKLKIVKPAYGNNLSARFTVQQNPCCLSVSKQTCQPVYVTQAAPGLVKIEKMNVGQADSDISQAVQVIPDPPETGLADADKVLVVGQGAGKKETVDFVRKLASDMGAELGASRPVVMNAWVEMNRLIGTSGLVISPKLCIAAGISGAGVFSVGIKNSQCIVAINTDPSAPIFKIADIGIVRDLKEFLAELADVIKTATTPNETGAVTEQGPEIP